MSGREYAELKSLSCGATRTWFNTRDPWFDPPEDEIDDEELEEERRPIMAKWIKTEACEKAFKESGLDLFVCSNCLFAYKREFVEHAFVYYCPTCGAKMGDTQ